MVVRSVRNWPGSKAKVSRSSGGMCSDTATDPAASGWMRETVRSWKRGTALLMVSVRLEVVEGFQAVEALEECFARGGAERRGLCGVVRAALGAGHRGVADRVSAELHHPGRRSEEHTPELQAQSNLAYCL